MTEERYMKRCLELARLGAGSASPNPMVGCVVVHHDRIIGEGWHRRCGGPHAEVNAIADVEARGNGALLADSTLYVSLEPCSHWGKTPPCADLIVEKGIPRVVVGCIDTYCEVSGRGVARLREAGIEVKVGVLEAECRWLNRRFFTAQSLGRPYVILKWAQTVDGYLDAERPSAAVPAAWMTGSAARMWVHRWRAEEDAILVGSGTAAWDNPSLTVRDWQGRNPLRVVLDRRLGLSPELKLFRDGAAQTVLFTAAGRVEAARQRFAEQPHVRVEAGDTLEEVLRTLRQKPYEVQSMIVEGGRCVLEAFMAAGLWDEARVFTSTLSVRELYPASVLPKVVGIPAPVLPSSARLVGEEPPLGLRVYTASETVRPTGHEPLNL